MIKVEKIKISDYFKKYEHICKNYEEFQKTIIEKYGSFENYMNSEEYKNFINECGDDIDWNNY